MSNPRQFITRRKDANHGEIVDVMRGCGAGVYEAADDGSPFDLIVFWRRTIMLVEVKADEKKKLKPRSVELLDLARRHGCEIKRVDNAAQALALLGARVSA